MRVVVIHRPKIGGLEITAFIPLGNWNSKCLNDLRVLIAEWRLSDDVAGHHRSALNHHISGLWLCGVCIKEREEAHWTAPAAGIRYNIRNDPDPSTR